MGIERYLLTRRSFWPTSRASWVADLPKVMPGTLGTAASDWLGRVLARPCFASALGNGRTADPFTFAATGPETTRWG